MLKFFVLAAFVAIVAITANAQTTGSSSGGAEAVGGMVSNTMSQIAERLVTILELLGGLLQNPKIDLGPVLAAIVDNLLSTVCLLLKLVNQILSELGGKTQGLHMCPVSGGVPVQPMGTTVSGSVGL